MAQTANTSNPTKVVTNLVRFSYVHVFAPTTGQNNDQEPKYSTAILIRKTDKETVKKVEAAIEAAKELGKSKWGGKIPARLKTPLRDGDEERPDDEAYAGMYFLNASSKRKPSVVDLQLDVITDEMEFYSGCWGRASLNFYPFDVQGNRGVAVGLNNIQKVRDGEPLSGKSRPEDDFSDEFEDDLDDIL